MAWIYWLVIAILIIGIGAWAIRREKPKVGKTLVGVGAVVASLLVAILLLSIPHDSTGVAAAVRLDPYRIFTATISSPVNEADADTSPGSLIVLYRFGCEDCERTYKVVKEALPQTQWVSSRSPLGKELVEKYNVAAVPTGIYFRRNNVGNQAEVIQATVFEAGEDDKAVPNWDAINTLADAVKEGK